MTTNSTIASRPISSLHDRGKIYLQLFRQESEGLPVRMKVMPTELGRRTLNVFWPLWLRQMILDTSTPEALFSVEIQKRYVMIGGGASNCALEETVGSLARLIRPIPSILHLEHEAQKHMVRWSVGRGRCYIPMGMMLGGLKLPPGTELSFISQPYHDEYPSLSISYRHNDKRSLRDLRLDIELQVALMCV